MINKSLTMTELAKLAEVNVSTVSRALNGSTLVKAETRDRILKVAGEHHFIANAMASGLRAKTTQTLSVMFPPVATTGQSISDPFFLQMFGAITEAASKKGYHIIVSCRDGHIEDAERKFLQSRRADGAIIIGQHGREKDLNTLFELEPKIVVWGGHSESVKYPVIGSDNRDGGRKATGHLLALGHTRIAFVGNIELPEVALRHQGYLDALSDYGLDADANMRVHQNFSGETLSDSLTSLFETSPDTDALFCASDVLAMSASAWLQSKGLSVPKDISLVGYDDIGAAQYAVPPLTTVSQNISLGGEMLVETLLKRIHGENVQGQILPTKLVIRQSTRARGLSVQMHTGYNQ